VVVLGTNHLRNDSGVTDPQWSCYVDGVASTLAHHFKSREQLGVLLFLLLNDGPHTITVNATVAKSQTFWFDYALLPPLEKRITCEQNDYVD
jgi:hypothetical protein